MGMMRTPTSEAASIQAVMPGSVSEALSGTSSSSLPPSAAPLIGVARAAAGRGLSGPSS